jgi:hypothetical protein
VVPTSKEIPTWVLEISTLRDKSKVPAEVGGHLSEAEKIRLLRCGLAHIEREEVVRLALSGTSTGWPLSSTPTVDDPPTVWAFVTELSLDCEVVVSNAEDLDDLTGTRVLYGCVESKLPSDLGRRQPEAELPDLGMRVIEGYSCHLGRW